MKTEGGENIYKTTKERTEVERKKGKRWRYMNAPIKLDGFATSIALLPSVLSEYHIALPM